MNPLEDLRALCGVRAEIERQIDVLAGSSPHQLAQIGVKRWLLALGLSRSDLYRRYAGRFGPTGREIPPATAGASQQ